MDVGFWAPLFGFLTALIGAIRWLVKVIFVYRQRINAQKFKDETSVEQMKRENTVKMVGVLKVAVDEIKPTLQEHSKLLEGFQHSFDLMQTIEAEATHMMSDLKSQYSTFNEQVNKFNSIGDSIMERVDKIETEILELKKGSGNIFVTTKKKD